MVASNSKIFRVRSCLKLQSSKNKPWGGKDYALHETQNKTQTKTGTPIKSNNQVWWADTFIRSLSKISLYISSTVRMIIKPEGHSFKSCNIWKQIHQTVLTPRNLASSGTNNYYQILPCSKRFPSTFFSLTGKSTPILKWITPTR